MASVEDFIHYILGQCSQLQDRVGEIRAFMLELLKALAPDHDWCEVDLDAARDMYLALKAELVAMAEALPESPGDVP